MISVPASDLLSSCIVSVLRPQLGRTLVPLMAPKIDKKVQQAAAKKIEDSTFGMKNKNKCVAQPRKSKRVGSARWP